MRSGASSSFRDRIRRIQRVGKVPHARWMPSRQRRSAHGNNLRCWRSEGKTSVTPVDAGRKTPNAGGILTRCRSYPCRGTSGPQIGSGARAPGLLTCSRALTGLSFGACSGRCAGLGDVGAAVNDGDRRTLVRSFARMRIQHVCVDIDSTIRDVCVSCVCVCRGTTRALQWRRVGASGVR